MSIEDQKHLVAREKLSFKPFNDLSNRMTSIHTTDLKVVVNGTHTFFLNKKPLLFRCGRIMKLYKKLLLKTHPCQGLLQMQLVDFPGGAEAFELAVRFCYCDARIAINPVNVSKLRCASEYLEMTEDYCERNLIAVTESFLKDVMFWDWDDVLSAFKACEEVFPVAEKTHLIERYVEAIVLKIISTLSDYSPFSSSSPDSVPYGFSRTNASKRSSRYVSKTWWFSDLSTLSISLMERILKALQLKNVDNKMLARFLFHYVRFSLPILSYSVVSFTKRNHQNEGILQDSGEKMQQEVLDKVVSLLARLERTSASCKSLFSLLRVSVIRNASKLCRKHLERMIGSQLHMASLDNILIPSQPPRGRALYDVDLVLRLVEHFLKEQHVLPQSSVSDNLNTATSLTTSSSTAHSPFIKVGKLMDKYIAEVAPDANLKPRKFQALTQCLPDCARPKQDGLYIALDIYLEAHPGITEAEAFGICKGLDYQKLSPEGCEHLARNIRLPTRFALQVLVSQQSRLRTALVESSKPERGSMNTRLLRGKASSQLIRHSEPLIGHSEPLIRHSEPLVQISEPLIAHSEPLAKFGYILRQNEELKTYLQKMQSRVVELEGMCKSMKSKVAKHSKYKGLVC